MKWNESPPVCSTPARVLIPSSHLGWIFHVFLSFLGLSLPAQPTSDLHSSDASQPVGPKFCASAPGQVLPPLNALYLTVSGRLLQAPRAVWRPRTVLVVQRRSKCHHDIHPVNHHYELKGCIRTHPAALGLFVRWRKGAHSGKDMKFT